MAKKELTEAVKTEMTETVFVPKTVRDDDGLYVAVNGKKYLLRKGEQISVPEAVAEVIRNSVRSALHAEEYINKACMRA